MTIETIVEGLFFPEGPRWSATENRFYFSDILGKKVYRLHTDHSLELVFNPSEKPSGLGWLPNGDLLVVLTESQKIIRLEKDKVLAGGLSITDAHGYADISTPYGTGSNDMVVAADGTAYAGVYLPGISEEQAPGPRNLPRMGYVVMLKTDGSSEIVSSRVCFPNGSCVTPDGKTFILSETFSYMISAWDINDDGTLSNRRPFAYLGVPTDGLCLDAEGCVWVACPYFQYGDSGGYLRVADGGEVRQIIEVDHKDKSAYACRLGGTDGKDLYLCESTVLGRERQPGDGRIRLTRVDVPGVIQT